MLKSQPFRFLLAFMVVSLAWKYPLIGRILFGYYSGLPAVLINVAIVAWMFLLLFAMVKGINSRRAAADSFLLGIGLLAMGWYMGWRTDTDMTRMFLLLRFEFLNSPFVCCAYGAFFYSLIIFINPSLIRKDKI